MPLQPGWTVTSRASAGSLCTAHLIRRIWPKTPILACHCMRIVVTTGFIWVRAPSRLGGLFPPVLLFTPPPPTYLLEPSSSNSRPDLPTYRPVLRRQQACNLQKYALRARRDMGFRSVELSSSVLSSLVAQRRRERRGSGHLLLRRGSSIPGRIAHGGNTAQYGERLTKVTGLR